MITYEALAEKHERIAVVGLGYVGLPLAVGLARHFSVVGYDLNERRIQELQTGVDRTREVDRSQLEAAAILFTADPSDLPRCRLIIVAVPTPIDDNRIPDLGPLRQASETVGRHLQPGSCVVYESTVYPGATEEVCVPILQAASGLSVGTDFGIGYSPERINPGDRAHSLETIVKVVSGGDAPTLQLLTSVYGRVVHAGVHPVSSIKVAEAAKVIENTQRDLNIALMNELAMIFDRLNIDTQEVLNAAGTKWNFLPFRPGLVGGHCIGVDPYYLTFKAEALDYHPEIILAGRRINDHMAKFIAEKTVKLLIAAGKQVQGARVAVLGITFKENVPDLRNTRVVDIIRELEDYGVTLIVNDPLADAEEARQYYGIELSPLAQIRDMDAVIVSVIHQAYRDMGLDQLAGLCRGTGSVLIDIKGAFDPDAAADGGLTYWRL